MLGADDSLDLQTLGARLRAGVVRPRDVVAGVLERIAARGDDKVWIRLTPRGALQARAAALERLEPARASAVRRALRHQGQHRLRRRADHGRVPRLRVHPVGVRAGRPAPARCRRDPDRQDEPRPVRHRPGRHAFAVRRVRERFRRTLHLRRLELRVGGRRRGRPGQLRARHRHRRLRTRARGVQQHRRAQADARPAQRARRGAGVPLARLRLDLRPDRRRYRGGARGRRRVRSGRSVRAALGRGASAPGSARRLPHRHSARGAARVLRQSRGRAAVPRGSEGTGRAGCGEGRDRLRAVPRNGAPALRRTLGRRALSSRSASSSTADRKRSFPSRGKSSAARRSSPPPTASRPSIASRRCAGRSSPSGSRSTCWSRRRPARPTRSTR